MDKRVGELLEEHLKERPLVTLQQRCDYVKDISEISMSRSIARIGSTTKKGDESSPSATSS
jgi:hypothetical protein